MLSLVGHRRCTLLIILCQIAHQTTRDKATNKVRGTMSITFALIFGSILKNPLSSVHRTLTISFVFLYLEDLPFWVAQGEWHTLSRNPPPYEGFPACTRTTGSCRNCEENISFGACLVIWKVCEGLAHCKMTIWVNFISLLRMWIWKFIKKSLTSWLPRSQNTNYTKSVPEQNRMQTILGERVGQVALQCVTSWTLAVAMQSQDPPQEALRIYKRNLSFLNFVAASFIELQSFRHYSHRWNLRWVGCSSHPQAERKPKVSCNIIGITFALWKKWRLVMKGRTKK